MIMILEASCDENPRLKIWQELTWVPAAGKNFAKNVFLTLFSKHSNIVTNK